MLSLTNKFWHIITGTSTSDVIGAWSFIFSATAATLLLQTILSISRLWATRSSWEEKIGHQLDSIEESPRGNMVYAIHWGNFFPINNNYYHYHYAALQALCGRMRWQQDCRERSEEVSFTFKQYKGSWGIRGLRSLSFRLKHCDFIFIVKFTRSDVCQEYPRLYLEETPRKWSNRQNFL